MHVGLGEPRKSCVQDVDSWLLTLTPKDQREWKMTLEHRFWKLQNNKSMNMSKENKERKSCTQSRNIAKTLWRKLSLKGIWPAARCRLFFKGIWHAARCLLKEWQGSVKRWKWCSWADRTTPTIKGKMDIKWTCEVAEHLKLDIASLLHTNETQLDLVEAFCSPTSMLTKRQKEPA